MTNANGTDLAAEIPNLMSDVAIFECRTSPLYNEYIGCLDRYIVVMLMILAIRTMLGWRLWL